MKKQATAVASAFALFASVLIAPGIASAAGMGMENGQQMPMGQQQMGAGQQSMGPGQQMHRGQPMQTNGRMPMGQGMQQHMGGMQDMCARILEQHAQMMNGGMMNGNRAQAQACQNLNR